MYQIILASKSPRRKELLEQIGVVFTCIRTETEEKISAKDPEEVVKELSRQKAAEVSGKVTSDWTVVIGADTVVAVDGEILGKPKDMEDACRMLRLLQGRCHDVYTGVTLFIRGCHQEDTVTFAVKTKVWVYPMDQMQIIKYVATQEPMDKAGAYGIQGKFAAYIEKIEGDYNNVVGLPVSAIYQELYSRGIDFLQNF